MLKQEALTHAIVGAAIDVHRTLGPGLLEGVYEECLAFELRDRDLDVKRQVTVPLVYKGNALNSNLRIDLLVNNAVVVELKAIESLMPIHEAQLMTYLRLMGKEVGLLINFNVPVLKQGIVRRVL
ncbi:MAG TPA: GxxExxY protein [Tepidiformaceae bacterium]|nr:GxxExxY protein [Tepidiformaceae bacterium]